MARGPEAPGLSPKREGIVRIKLQPASFVDNMKEGHEMTKLPYPFVADENGDIEHQDLWQGNPLKVIGFQNDLAQQQIDLWWKDAMSDPQQAVGKYLVTLDSQGDWGSHTTAIASVEVLES